MDGAVMAKDSINLSESMGRTDKFFRHSIAYKFADEVYETKLLDVEWTLGRTGQLTPTAVFEPVWIDGSEVSRASVHNVSILKDLELTKNCTVGVFKANCIIPQVRFAKQDGDEEILIPTICSVCGGKTEIKKDNVSEVLMCTNPNCSGKLLGKLNHFVSRKCMDINGLSEATLNTLISHGFLHEYKDIYHLNEHRNKLILLDGYGKKSIDNLLESIEKSRDVKLENFIAALGIPNIGLSAAKTISTACEGSFDKLFEMWNYEYDFTTLPDFGDVTAESFVKYFDTYINDILSLCDELNFITPEKQEIKNNPFSGKTLCVTGKLNHFTRDSINEKIISLGAKAASSVSKNTDYLITNEQSGSSKYKKAVELNVPIITEEEFLNLIGE
jgi:DNA ligase (NAD+)